MDMRELIEQLEQRTADLFGMPVPSLTRETRRRVSVPDELRWKWNRY